MSRYYLDRLQHKIDRKKIRIVVVQKLIVNYSDPAVVDSTGYKIHIYNVGFHSLKNMAERLKIPYGILKHTLNQYDGFTKDWMIGYYFPSKEKAYACVERLYLLSALYMCSSDKGE